MKTDRRTREKAIAHPPARTILVHGADAGGIDAAVARLLNGGEALRLTNAEAKADPGLLSGGAGDLFAAHRAIRVDDADDTLSGPLGRLLDAGGPDARLVLRAGALKAKSRLRKLVEGHSGAVAIQLPEPDDREIEAIAVQTLGDGLPREARQALVERLPRDRGAIRRELEKLTLYAGDTPITHETVMAAVADATTETIDRVVQTTFDGDVPGSARAVRRLEGDGTAWMQILRSIAIHVDSLRRLRDGIDTGARLNDALRDLRPPAFGARREALSRQVRLWDPASLERALARIDAAEADAKSGHLPPELILKHLIWALAVRARQLNRKRP